MMLILFLTWIAMAIPGVIYMLRDFYKVNRELTILDCIFGAFFMLFGPITTIIAIGVFVAKVISPVFDVCVFPFKKGQKF